MMKITKPTKSGIKQVIFAILFVVLTITSNVLMAQTPGITSFSPAVGSPGTLVTITGTNLGSLTAFTIGGATAVLVSNTGTQLVGLVMPGAITGKISLTTAGGTGVSTGNFTLQATPFPGRQQGSKLFGTGGAGSANQGHSVSVSADGNTAIVGGVNDNGGAGAIWVYTRSAGVWNQQGSKLTGTGAVGLANQGCSVSISADGNTMIAGGNHDNSDAGAAWVYTRSGGVWTQQGNKLVGTGAVNGPGGAYQGTSVSVSADGNTAIVGGFNDNNGAGAAWVYTRSGGVWTQAGNKLTGTGASGTASQGYSVSISADGKTVIIGGTYDNSDVGAVWVFIQSGGGWTQQGNKLVGLGAIGTSEQGSSICLSADGNTAIVGGYNDNGGAGAIWVYTRSAGVWTQQGSKLVGSGAINGSNGAFQGGSVSVSADGNTAIAGGNFDNKGSGAVWVYIRSGGVWTQEESNLNGTGAVGSAYQGSSVCISSDGTTAIEGGYFDNSDAGAAWIFIPCLSYPTVTAKASSTTVCFGATVVLTGGGTSTYSWTGGVTDAVGFKDTLTATYTVTGTDGAGCKGTSSVTVAVNPNPVAITICSVTVDSLSKNNIILWSKPVSSSIRSFLIYRDTANNAYGLIGEVKYDSLSLFADTVRTLYAANGDPNNSSWRYKIAVKDTCGAISALSPYHQTLFNQNNNGNFSWNNYVIEGQVLPVPALSNYLFQRDNLSNGNFKTITGGTLSASSIAFTDPQYSAYQKTASWRVMTVWSISCTPTLRTEQSATVNTSRSNIKNNLSVSTGIPTEGGFNFDMYPNPAKNQLTIEYPVDFRNCTVCIFNLMGELVYTNVLGGSGASTQKMVNTEHIDVSTIASGIYTVCVSGNKGKVNKRFVVLK